MVNVNKGSTLYYESNLHDALYVYSNFHERLSSAKLEFIRSLTHILLLKPYQYSSRHLWTRKYASIVQQVLEQYCSFHNTADRHLVDIITKIKMVSFKFEEVGYKNEEIPDNKRGFVVWQFIRAVYEYAVDRLHKRTMIVPTMIAMTRHVRTKHFLYE